jgi:hypothetical protein
LLLLLLDKTIAPEEYRSNLVFSVLKLLFDAVNIGTEEVYVKLKRKGIEVSPKLLIQLKKERKLSDLQNEIPVRFGFLNFDVSLILFVSSHMF